MRGIQDAPAPLEELLKINKPAETPSAEVIGRVKCRNVSVEVLEISPEPEVRLPAFLMTADRTPANRPVLLVLDEKEHDRLWFAPEVDQVLTEASPIVCSAAVRGVGSLIPEFQPGAAEYESGHRKEVNYAWGSLALGKPLVGQRVTDVLALVAGLGSHPSTKGRDIYVAALGKLTVPALFAAALDPAIKRLYVVGGLVSFQNLVEHETYQHSFANFIPNLLNHTDLPKVAASISPRKLVLAGSIDANCNPVGIAELRAIYSEADRAGNLSVVASGEWSAQVLLSWANSQS
jgi:hypothetical protein